MTSMDIEIGKGKTARRAYGLDEIAIVPSRRTRDPEDIDISWNLGDLHLDLPCLASAIDAAVDPATAGIIGSLGGLPSSTWRVCRRGTRTPGRSSRR